MESLYSRYVPPKKKQKVDSASLPSIKPEQIKYVTPTKSDASATYMRYVPPSKSKSSHSSLASVITNTPRIEQNLEREDEVKTSKTASDIKISTTSSGDMMDIDASIIPKEKLNKQEKKLVLSSKAKHVVEDVGEEETDKRHASILARREKSLKKAEKLAKKTAKKVIQEDIADVNKDIEMEDASELHPLEPLPQPEPAAGLTGKPTYSSLPSWIMSPIKTGPNVTASFSELGVQDRAIDILKAKGYKEAFAVQAAVLPLLLPGPRQQPGDVLVSAATGSGKTLAYVLPMTEDISKTALTRLSGLIVMPTRELVSQAKEVCDICTNAFSHNRRTVKIGLAMGSQSLQAEQVALMDQVQEFDPATYRKQKNNKAVSNHDLSEEMDSFQEEYSLSTVQVLPDHRLVSRPKVDILICTPGRLVEHLKYTPGFTLQYLKWLVIDEADKLLDQSFQEWIQTVMAHLPNAPPRNKLRKIILSATMTRDIGKLSSLKLNCPKLVVLEGETNEVGESNSVEEEETFALPGTLHESAIKVGDDAEKPLYLIELLQSRKMMGTQSQDLDDSSSDDSSSDDSSSDDSSSDDSDNDTSDEDTSSSDGESSAQKPSISSVTSTMPKPTMQPRGVLIFTNSNENALRLSRLLVLMNSSFADILGTLSSTIADFARKKTLASFQSGKISILIATDLVSRGLDLPGLAHVVNYDLPTSIGSYVHRVGRTARAGKKGNAWTLYTHAEGRWFWNSIARSSLVNRSSGKVDKVKIDGNAFGDAQRAQYEKCLEILGQEAKGQK